MLSNNFMGSMILYIITTIGIIIAAYYTTIWIAKKSKLVARGRHISLLEKVLLPGGTSISVIKVGTSVYIIANNGKNMEQLDRMTFDEWKESIHRDDVDFIDNYQDKYNHNPFSITDYIKKYQTGRKDGKQKNDGS